MKKIICLFLIVLVFTTSGSAQDYPENSILLLNGGEIDVNLQFYWQVLSTQGQNLRFKSKGSWDVWENPAAILAFRQYYFSVSIHPGIIVDPGKYYDINDTVAEEVDAAIVDYRVDDTTVHYPKIHARGGQKSGLFGFHFVYPLQLIHRRSVFAFEITQPLYINAYGSNNGLSTMIEARKTVGDEDKIIHMRMNTSFLADLQLRATAYTFRFAQQVNHKFGVAVSFGKIKMRSYVKGIADINGIMETAGTEYAFNDPYDPQIDFEAGETNTLDQSVFMDFSGSGWSLQTGGLFRLSNTFVLGFDYNRPASVVLSGKMEMVQFKLPALNADALLSDDPDAELVDPTKLNLAKLTLTEAIDKPTSDHVTVSFPASVGFQLSVQRSFFESTLSCRRYLNPFGYKFINEKRYADLDYGLNLDLTIGSVMLSFGIIKANLFHEIKDEIRSSSQLMIPNGSLGFAFFILNHYHITTKLFAAPTPGVGIRLGYFL